MRCTRSIPLPHVVVSTLSLCSSALAGPLLLLATAGALALASGCVTDNGGSPVEVAAPEVEGGDAVKTEGEADGASPDVAAATPAASGERLELGPIESDDLKKAIYEAMEARLAHGDATAAGAEAATEIGDYEAFKFTIVKLTRGADDVSGDPTTTPDGMDVEVTGWLRRTADSGSGEKSECVSFDAQVAMQHDQSGSGWTMAKDKDVAFGRQDQEDCY